MSLKKEYNIKDKVKPDKLKMHFTIIDETVLPLSSFCQILVETSDKNDF